MYRLLEKATEYYQPVFQGVVNHRYLISNKRDDRSTSYVRTCRQFLGRYASPYQSLDVSNDQVREGHTLQIVECRPIVPA